jgi:GNAT superfamily N-acetyltransferase
VPEPAEIRPFRRDDRAQLVELVNTHVGAVLPGVTLSANAVLSQLERDPNEYVVDPWAVDRATLVAVARDRIVAAAHLVRYGADARVSASYRDSGEIKWLVAWPSDAIAGGPADALAAACLAQLTRWDVRTMYADGSLPAPAIYGVPDVWPHVGEVYERAGFVHRDRTELVLLAEVAALPPSGPPPVPGLTLQRHVGSLATAFTALAGGATAGFIEVGADLTAGGRLSRLAGWGELDNLHVEPGLRRQGIATWLLGAAADWLRLGGARVLLAYGIEDDDEADGEVEFLRARGFRVLTRSRRALQRP